MAEHWIVVPGVVGSSPITHPIKTEDTVWYPLFLYPQLWMIWYEMPQRKQSGGHFLYHQWRILDFGLDRAKCAIIITEQPQEVCSKLCEIFGSGATYLDAKGGYSNKEKSMIYFVLNRYQIVRMKETVHEIDPLAYITISEVADVFPSNNK